MTGYLTDQDLATRYAISRVTVWRWVSTGRLPAPVKIGPNCSRWIAEEVEAIEQGWLATRNEAPAAPAGV